MDLRFFLRLRPHQRRVPQLIEHDAKDTTLAGPLQVAVGVIEDWRGHILIARRPPHLHEGGKWEFPGGKIEPRESRLAALKRELAEELGIEITAARPLIRIHHAYPGRPVVLDVWRVRRWAGVAQGRERQELRWVAPQALSEFEFPAANLPIVAAARLPGLYLVSPEPAATEPHFFELLEVALQGGLRLFQLRARALPAVALAALLRRVRTLCDSYGARVVLNGEPELALAGGAHGVHLSSARLRALSRRPLPADALVGASCHDAEELAQAARVGADFAVLGPVQPSPSHPGAPTLGWERFARLVEHAVLPVYALGGLGSGDWHRATNAGAQGIAFISAYWLAPDPRQVIAECSAAEDAPLDLP